MGETWYHTCAGKGFGVFQIGVLKEDFAAVPEQLASTPYIGDAKLGQDRRRGLALPSLLRLARRQGTIYTNYLYLLFIDFPH